MARRTKAETAAEAEAASETILAEPLAIGASDQPASEPDLEMESVQSAQSPDSSDSWPKPMHRPIDRDDHYFKSHSYQPFIDKD
jgi:hypothetical protein